MITVTGLNTVATDHQIRKHTYAINTILTHLYSFLGVDGWFDVRFLSALLLSCRSDALRGRRRVLPLRAVRINTADNHNT